MTAKVAYLQLAVEGIQKYICSTGKLKEMIGGSEIVNYIASPEFYKTILAKRNLTEAESMAMGADKFIVTQANAGSLCLVVPTAEDARFFLREASREILATFPGLPFYGAVCEFLWSDDATGLDAYKRARREARDVMSRQRDGGPTPQGSGLLPVLRASRLDGLPAVGRDDDELISLPSKARRNPEMIELSRKRLRGLVKKPENLVWKDNLEELLGHEGGKVALICMDGNDLGKLFGARLAESAGKSLREYLLAMKDLSRRLQNCNEIAFTYACERVARYEAVHGKRSGDAIVMPLRPLVMGGDDITIIARADVALPFVEMFARKFDEVGGKDGFSIGVGMVVMDSSYPFAKAFPLAESLQDSAKNLTCHLEPGERPSSLDYLVLTEEVENDAELVRQRLLTCPAGEKLTGKPFVLKDDRFTRFLLDGRAVASSLSRSLTRAAWAKCRQGPGPVKSDWLNLKENVARGLGGRGGKLMKPARFAEIFPDNFFIKRKDGKFFTYLGDYLELERLLPTDEKAREVLFNILAEPAGEDAKNV